MSDWTKNAACRGMTDVMFPARGDTEGVRLAKAVCASCPVIEDCRDFITRNPERYGVWAGIAGKAITEERKKRSIGTPRAKHGTRSKYVTGCRCEICTAANNRYMRNSRRMHRAI